MHQRRQERLHEIAEIKSSDLNLSELNRPSHEERLTIFWDWYNSLTIEQRKEHYHCQSNREKEPHPAQPHYNKAMADMIETDRIINALNLSEEEELKIHIVQIGNFPSKEDV